MRKVIAAINMTLDGFCDHTAIIPDEEIHQHYTDLLSTGGIILYGRITYQLMEYWRPLAENPSDEKAMDLNLIDELQLCVHPVIAGGGLPLFEKSNESTILKLIRTKTFGGGAVSLYYAPSIL